MLEDTRGLMPETDTVAEQSVLVVDDQRTFTDLLEATLSAQPDMDCVGSAYDLGTALALVERHRPDVVIMDVHFEGDQRTGVEVAGEIVANYPGTQVVLLTGRADPSLVRAAADAGVSSLIVKDGSLKELLTALRTVTPDGLAVHPTLLRSLVGSEAVTPKTTELTRRESDVLAMLVIGLDARAISDQLGISLHTCRGYIKTLLRKLNAHSQLEAVATARRQGLLGT